VIFHFKEVIAHPILCLVKDAMDWYTKQAQIYNFDETGLPFY